MNTNLEATLSQTLGRALGLPSGASELALARADREQLGTALMHSLTGQNLLSPADVYRIVPRRTWVRRKAEARLSRDEFDGLYRLVRVQALAGLVFGDAARAHGVAPQPEGGHRADRGQGARGLSGTCWRPLAVLGCPARANCPAGVARYRAARQSAR